MPLVAEKNTETLCGLGQSKTPVSLTSGLVRDDRPREQKAPVEFDKFGTTTMDSAPSDTWIEAAPLTRLRPNSLETKRCKVLKTWICEVIEVGNNSVWLNLTDALYPGPPQEVAELKITEIEKEDRPLLEPGVIIYWTIGWYWEGVRGGVRRLSELRLKRVPLISSRSMREFEEQGEAFLKEFEVDGTDNAAGK